MSEDNVQPISPKVPSAGITAANFNAPLTPSFATNISLAATTPPVFTSINGSVSPLPAPTIATIANQQAIMNNNSSEQEKLTRGILPTTAGVTLEQASAQGQVMKPGSGDFVKRLRQLAPELPLEKVASKVTVTGNMGVTDINNLITDKNVQLSTVSNSIQTAAARLTFNGTINKNLPPTQTSGVIMAATTVGVAVVTDLLRNPQAVPSIINGSYGVPNLTNVVSQSITSGNFAAGLADGVANGAAGISASLSGFTNNALGGNLLANSAAKLQSKFQEAFLVAEKSFGNLKAGVANLLGGGENPKPAQSQTLQLAKDLNAATSELANAETELLTARSVLDLVENTETLSRVREAESRVTAAKQKIQSIKSVLTNSASTNLLSAQAIQARATAAMSGELNSPTTANTGVNALPGGLGAFVNITGGLAVNSIGAAKDIVTSYTNGITDVSQLSGNLLGNLQDRITNGAKTATAELITKTTRVQGLITGGNEIAGNIVADAQASTASLLSNVTTTLDSIGSSFGISTSTLSTNTEAENYTVINATLDSTLDPKVPPPVFTEVPIDKSPDELLKTQVNVQLQIDELKAERESLALLAAQVSNDYFEFPTADKLLTLNNLNQQITQIDIQISAKQEQYQKTLE